MRGKAFVRQTKRNRAFLQVLIPVLIFILIVAVILAGVNNVLQSGRDEQLKVMEQAVRRSVVQCYAIEGRYPQSLDYLADNYGLILDKEKYVYHYERLGANLVPEIFIFLAD